MNRIRYRKALGPYTSPLVQVVFAGAAIMGLNAGYLALVTLLEQATGDSYQDWFYLYMFLAHVVLGIVLMIPVFGFIAGHARNVYNRPNRPAVRAGLTLAAITVILFASGFFLLRLDGVFVVKSPVARSTAYWLHVLTPIAVVWLFVVHRLAGKKIKWGVGARWGAAVIVGALAMAYVQSLDPRSWAVEGNPEGAQYFFPSLARTLDGNFIPSSTLMADQYCKECHADTHATWSSSVHRFASFNNPVYLSSVRETREAMMERDGNIRGSRFCAGCHDPVPFFSGDFNDPDFDDVRNPTAHAGITCSVCHSIVNVNSPMGNADYTIAPPVHYPFFDSESATLKWINRQLIKAKPEFHKRAFLRPVHETTEFCGSCHKVHLPQELNDYRWLRGQNHYDSFFLSGVSGQGVASFYYPPEAEKNCNNCHMPQIASDDFGANDVDGELKIRSHLFPSANTAIPKLVKMENADEVIQQHRDFLRDNVRIDIFGIREGVGVNGELHAPPGAGVELEPGKSYTVEVVIRTLKLGHHLTQGTVDSNQLWLQFEVLDGTGRELARSGAIAENGEVDPASHFVNAFVLDRHGMRIDRRNAEDIFVALYNNQIAPGSARLVRYEFTVPEDAVGPLRLSGRLLYRKFDSTLMRHVMGPDYQNDLPVSVLGEGTTEVAVAGAPGAHIPEATVLTGNPPEWMRWNDYGIALLSAGQGADLQNAESAFTRVEALGNFNGPLNLARVHLAMGRVRSEARESLERARKFEETPIWSYLWLSGQLSMKNGDYDAAIRSFSEIVAGGFAQAENRGFDFSKDYRLLNVLGQASYLKAMSQRRAGAQAVRDGLQKAVEWYDKALALDPENAKAHWGLKQAYTALDQPQEASRHSALHQKYKRDDLAEGEAMLAARERYHHAAHASDDPVIYDLTSSDPSRK